MTSKLSAIFAVLALSSAVAVHAHDRPNSSSETGSVPPTHHEVAPSQAMPAFGGTGGGASQGEVRGPRWDRFEAPWPSSVSETGPAIANERDRR